MRARRILGMGAATMAAAIAACGGGQGVQFDAPHAVSAGTHGGAAPNFSVAPDGREAVAWVSAADGGTDGRLHVAVGDSPPVMLADSLGPIAPQGEAPPKLTFAPDGTMHALYVVQRVIPGRRFPASALRAVHSRDGVTWSAPVTITDDSLDFGSHNFHSLHAGADGVVYAAWLDGRAGKSAAWVASSRDGGQHWSANVRIAPTEACPCCRTAMTTGPDGRLYVAWREVFPGSERDIVIATSLDQGATFFAPVRVHDDRWVYDGCPHAGPSLAADARGRVHIAWWTGKEGRAGIWYARSDNGGASFGDPVAIDVAPHSRPSHAQVALSPGGDTVVVAWDDGLAKVPAIRVRVSRNGGGRFGTPIVVSDQAMAASFPVLALREGEVTVAWSQLEATAHQHAEHQRPNMKDPRAVMGLSAVGGAMVMTRRGRID